MKTINLKNMNLILFGFKGCGKTHFGKLLADKMHRPFIDIDEVIADFYLKENSQKKKVREIYNTLGKEGFRALEKRALGTLIETKNAIIALGGGTVLDPQNVELLKTIGALVYLKTSPEKLKKRIFKDEIPSFLDKKDPEASFLEMIHEREPIYRSIQARIIDTELLDEAGVLASLSSILLLEDPPYGF